MIAAIFVLIPIVFLILLFTAIYCGLRRFMGLPLKIIVICLLIAGYIFTLHGVLQEDISRCDFFMKFIYWSVGITVISVVYWGVVMCVWMIASPFLWLNKATTLSKEEKEEKQKQKEKLSKKGPPPMPLRHKIHYTIGDNDL